MTGVQIPNDQRAIGLCTCPRFTSITFTCNGDRDASSNSSLDAPTIPAPDTVIWAVNFELTDTRAVRTQSSPPAPSAVTLRFEVASIKACKGEAAAAGQGQKGGNGGASSSPVTFNLPCMPVRFFINLAYLISNFQPDAVGAEASHQKACEAQPNEDPPGLRREEIFHPRSPGGLVARHDGRCRVAVEIEAHCDKCFLAGGARGGKHRTRSGQIDA